MTEVRHDSHRHTVEEYARLEELSEVPHEYYDGEIRERAVNSYRHALIATNINCEIGTRLKGRPCYNLGCIMRIATPHRCSTPMGASSAALHIRPTRSHRPIPEQSACDH